MIVLIKERLKGLLALVLAGATALTTTTAVSAAESVTEGKLPWGGYAFLESDAIISGVYVPKSDSFSDYIVSDPAKLDPIAGINDNFYTAGGYKIGWGYMNSGDNIEFPHGEFHIEEHKMDEPITVTMIEGIDNSPEPGKAYKTLVVNDVAKEFTIDYYDIFGDKKGTFFFSDGVQKIDEKDLFEDGEYKKYTLIYNDTEQSVEFSLDLSSSEHPSAWTELTSYWNTNYNEKTFDQSKLSLHRKADFSVNSYYNNATPDDLSYLKARMHDDDLWWLRGEESKYIKGSDLYDYIDNYNSSSRLRLYFDNISIHLSSDPLEEEGYYELNSKPINKIPFDLNDMIDNVPEYNEVVWTLWNATESGWCHVKYKVATDQRRLVNINDLNEANDAVFEYKFVPIVYSVPVDGADALKVTVVDKEFPTDGGDYLFTYGDSVSKVVKNGEELWTEIAAVAADYDSTKAKLAKIQPITSAALNVKVPAIGGTPADAEAAFANYTVTYTKWNPEDSVFKANKEYTVTATLTPTLGYAFSADTTATVNSKPADANLNADGTLTVSYKFSATDKNTITSAEVTVTAPEEGKTPENTAELPADADYTVNSVSWNTDKEFTTGTEYTVTVELAPGADHKFSADATAAVNGSNAKIKLNSDGTLTVTYTFAKLEDEIDKELEKLHPVIKIPDGKPIPEDVIKKIKEKGKEVEIDYGDYSWIIKPDFEPGFVPKAIDLSLRKVGEKDWATVVNNVTGHKYKMQIDIAYTGNFGFTAYLVLDLSEGMKNAPAGDYYANLYQIVGNKLEWNGYSKLEADENGKWIAQLEFTHASEWLITIDSEINPGSDTKSDSSSSSSVIGSKTNLARTIKSVGWTKITDEIKNSSAGSTISITLNDETTMPADALQAAIDKGVKLVMDAGFGRIWTIDGKTAVPGKYIDLSISGVNVGIPEAAYADILCSDSRQLKLNARLLNFTAQLTAFIGNENIGQNAALYSYNEETGKLVFQDISVVDKNGNVIFDIKCGGRYFIALGSEVTSPYYLCGDVNGDGVVNAIDAAAILKNAVYGYPLDKRCGDTNGDGEVNAHDALPILHYVVGDVKILPVKDGE